ncbi:unnamed protein product [Fusarium venenatum]|uniref:Uncharacterized protein n=1 Tax=Fusarium venenatum TaxID=56646 RepID=A0A2L2TE78_9HYPO|nr:uncharacterized protein FVRRES_09359 [Fusarium venenatum]CEI69282.1 unnamed protein product [Fusarium venenatum]
MHNRSLLFWSVGLSGLGMAVGSACRPRTAEASTVSTATHMLNTATEAVTSGSPFYPTTFHLVSSTGPAENKVLRGESTDGKYALFDGSLGQDIPLSYEPETSRLRVSDSLCIYASYNSQLKTAPLKSCGSSPTSSYLKYDAPTGENHSAGYQPLSFVQFIKSTPRLQ